MNKPKKFVWIAVDPKFRKKIKSESNEKDMSMINYTKYLANNEYNLEENFKSFKKKQKDYDNPFKI